MYGMDSIVEIGFDFDSIGEWIRGVDWWLAGRKKFGATNWSKFHYPCPISFSNRHQNIDHIFISCFHMVLEIVIWWSWRNGDWNGILTKCTFGRSLALPPALESGYQTYITSVIVELMCTPELGQGMSNGAWDLHGTLFRSRLVVVVFVKSTPNPHHGQIGSLLASSSNTTITIPTHHTHRGPKWR